MILAMTFEKNNNGPAIAILERAGPQHVGRRAHAVREARRGTFRAAAAKSSRPLASTCHPWS
jgi:hypothetical protein